MPSLKARIRRLKKRLRGGELIHALVIVKEGDSVEDAWVEWEANHPLQAKHPDRLFRFTIRSRKPRRSAS